MYSDLPSGQIGLIDFGLHARIPRALRDRMLEMLFYQASGSVDQAVDAEPDPTRIREAVLRSSLGLITDPTQVNVQFVDALGTESETPGRGGLVVVDVEGVAASRILSGLWKSELRLSAQAADRLP